MSLDFGSAPDGQIAERLLEFTPRIVLSDHIDKVLEVGRTISEGITFKPRSASTFRNAVVSATRKGQRAFHWDDRRIFLYKLAALATDGQGYREIGTPSLHIAISDEKCNVHIDEFAFVLKGPFGSTYFSPDAMRHIGDELVYRAYVRKYLIMGLYQTLPDQIAKPAAQLLDRTYMVLPSTENRFDMRVGMGVRLNTGKYHQLNFEYTCGNSDCSDGKYMVNLNLKNF